MPLPLEDYVRTVLAEGERGQRLFEAVALGWEAFKVNQPRRGTWRRKSSSRNMVWEEVAGHLASLADDPGVEILDHDDTMSVIFDGEIMVRLKHADLRLVTQNVRTGRAVEYDDHEVNLFGRTGLQRVRLCYVLDQFETRLEWVGIAAHSLGRLLWKIELGAEGLSTALPRLPMSAPEIDTRRLARMKEQPSEQDKKKDDGK